MSRTSTGSGGDLRCKLRSSVGYASVGAAFSCGASSTVPAQLTYNRAKLVRQASGSGPTPSPEESPIFCCGRRSMRCDWPYSLKPLRQRAALVSTTPSASFSPCGQPQHRLGALATKIGDSSVLAEHQAHVQDRPGHLLVVLIAEHAPGSGHRAAALRSSRTKWEGPQATDKSSQSCLARAKGEPPSKSTSRTRSALRLIRRLA